MNTRSLLVIFLLITVIASFCLSGCAGENSSVRDDDVHQFIVNKRTGKIHSEDCPAVVQMNEKNKLYASDSLLNLLKQDYVVCRSWNSRFPGAPVCHYPFHHIPGHQFRPDGYAGHRPYPGSRIPAGRKKKLTARKFVF